MPPDEVVETTAPVEGAELIAIRSMVTEQFEQMEGRQNERMDARLEEMGRPVPVGIDVGGDVSPRVEPVASRYQPSDPLYSRLYRTNAAFRDCRSPEMDHWSARWLRAFTRGDEGGIREAYAKSAEAQGGLRATTLGGVLNASDPTAIVDGTGGHLLAQPFSDVVEIARQDAAVLPALVLNLTTEGSTLRVPTAGAVTAVTAAEGAAPAQAEPTFTSEMLILHKLGARMIASDEMLDDSPFNLVQIYGVRAGEGIGALEDSQICTTNGTSPNLTEAIAGGNVAEATTTVLIYEDIGTLFFALGKVYRRTAVWLANSVTLTLLTNMVDSQARPVLNFPNAPNAITDVPGSIGILFGKPVFEVPLADGTLLFGDPRGYGFVRKGGIVAKMDASVGFASDTVQFKFTERVDGRIIDDVAMKQMADLATVA